MVAGIDVSARPKTFLSCTMSWKAYADPASSCARSTDVLPTTGPCSLGAHNPRVHSVYEN